MPTVRRADVQHPSKRQVRIIDAAREQIGRPFSIGARKVATDCGGLLLDVGKRCGLHVGDLGRSYTLATSAGLALYVHLRDFGDEVSREEMEPGDVILYWIYSRSHPKHLAIWTGTSTIHATPNKRSVVESKGMLYPDRIFAVFRFRDAGQPPAHRVALNRHVVCERCVRENPDRFSRRGALFQCQHSEEVRNGG